MIVTLHSLQSTPAERLKNQKLPDIVIESICLRLHYKMVQVSTHGPVPDSTYYFSAEFQPSMLPAWLFYLTIVGLVVFIFRLIIEKELVEGQDSFVA